MKLEDIPTPRTDAQVARNLPHAKFKVDIEFARDLERKLFLAKQDAERLTNASKMALHEEHVQEQEAHWHLEMYEAIKQHEETMKLL